MEKHQKVLICGDTVLLAGLRASLESYPALEVTSLDRPVAAKGELFGSRPDVIIFELGTVQPALRCALLEEFPGLLLVGIDPGTHRVWVWSGQQLGELTTRDLVELIGRRSPWCRDVQAGGP